MTLAAAWLLARIGRVEAGRLEQWLGWGLAFLLLVAGTGELLSWGGWLGPAGFFTAHAIILVALAAGRGGALAGDARALRGLVQDAGRVWREGGPTAWLSGALLLVFTGFGVLALWGHPVVYDALAYRLSRIGLWLQDGRIAHYATDDQRLNYMPVAPDLVMAWLLGAHHTGYAWVGLAQTLGGALLLGATVGLARSTGLSRAAALGAAILPLGMANVVPQFTSAYTDLFTGGVFAAAFFLWLAALRRGQGTWLGGAGVALALGAKGTMFYLAPAALLWVGWCAGQHRTPWPAWRSTLLGGTLAALLVAVPGWVRNAQAYGSVMGPVEARQQQHGAALSTAEHGQKLGLNLTTTLAQLFEPNAQPPGWRESSRRIGETLARAQPRADKFSFDGLDRRANLEKVLQLPAPDADVTSCGVLSLVLLAVGLVAALFRRPQFEARLVLVWGGGVGCFVLCLYALLQWHPYSFRFWTLVAPWMAVVAAWGLESLPRPARLAGWVFVGGSTLLVFGSSTSGTYQAGWPAAMQPQQGLSFTVFSQVRQWTRTLDPSSATLLVALPVNQPLAAFLRTGEARRVELRRLSEQPPTAELAVRQLEGWLVVPAGHFSGREGRVEKREWLFFGDAKSPFSLAAYRRLSAVH